MTGYNRPAERLAARVALMLNKPGSHGDRVQVEPWLLDQELRKILSERYYQITLVGLDELGLRKPRDEYRTAYNADQFEEAEIGAGRWLDLVLDGPRQVHAARDRHEAHNLLLLFARRGYGWPAVDLLRSASEPRPAQMLPKAALASGATLSRLLERHGHPVSKNKARLNQGPLWLVVGAGSAEVIDTLSVWGAICAAPLECTVLSGKSKDEFVHLFARVVNVANRHWDALRRLGLSPPDWINRDPWQEDGKLSGLSASQALDALKFSARAQEIAQENGRTAPIAEDFHAAWTSCPILKRMTFDEFAQTPAGRSLMSADVVKAPLSLDRDALENAADDLADPVALAEDDALLDVLQVIDRRDDFDDAEKRVIRGIVSGARFVDLHKRDKVVRLKYRRLEDLSAALDDLQDRVISAVSGLGAETAVGV